MPLRNPTQLLAFSGLALVGAVVLLLTDHPVPDWLVGFIAAGVFGGAAVMTPGLHTVERLLGAVRPADAPEPPADPITPDEPREADSEPPSDAPSEPISYRHPRRLHHGGSR